MIACPNCAFELPGGSAFCSQCGSKLAGPVSTPEERKTVTTLFCDLVSFTAMSEAADPEDVDRLLRDYFARATKVIESHGGTVEKFIGDAVVGVFGVPAVHEDDPERAVRAGLRILEALEGMTRPDGSPLEARVGVDTGEALVRLDVDPASGRGFLAGDAVNTAARLQTAAPPGGLAVGTLTHELTSHVIQYEKSPPVGAKGKSEPVQAWEAIAPISRRGVDADAGGLTPFAGREVELAYLCATFDKVIAQASPQFALLVGEPGIGKSRLVRELLAHVDSLPAMTTWRQGYCPPFGEDLTYWALAEIVKGHAGIRDTDEPSTVEAKLDAIVPSGPDREWFRQRLRAFAGLSASEASREENFTAWMRFFEEVAAGRPTVLVFEDLHWADKALLAFLEYMLTHVAAVPLLIVATARPELFERHPGFASGGRVNRLELGPLSAGETVRLVAGLLGEQDERAKAVAQVVERCEGNPFYAEQSARLLGDAAPGAQLPGTVQAVIAARLDTLPAEQKALLADAAVVGTVFWDGALAALGPHETQGLEGMLSGLLECRLVRRIRESTMAGEREFAFVHALAREVAYRQLPRAARARRHAAVARWLEEKAEGRAEDLAEVLAHHYATAHELARSAGETELTTRLQGPAVRFLTLAGDGSFNLDLQSAERFYVAARQLCAPGDPERVHLDLKLGEALLWEGRRAESAALLQRAAAALQADGDASAAAIALVRLTRTQDNTAAKQDEVEGLFRKALSLLHGRAPSEELVTVLTEWGRYLSNSGESDDALAAYEQALKTAHYLGAPEPALALCLRGAERVSQGDPAFLEDYRRALEIAEIQGLGIERVRIWSNYASDIGLAEGPRRSLEEYARVFDFAAARGLTWLAGSARSTRVCVLVYAGEWDEALREAADVEHDIRQAAGDYQELVWTRLVTFLPLAWRGADADVRQGLSPTLEEVRRYLVGVDVFDALLIAAVVTARYDLDEARELLEESLTAKASTRRGWGLQLLPEGVRVALRCGDAGLAERLRQGTGGTLPFEQIALAAADALLAEAYGEPAAVPAFAEAAARWHDFGVPYEEAQALLGQGRCLMALDRGPEAALVLEKARDIFVRLGAKPALAETDLLVQQVASASH